MHLCISVSFISSFQSPKNGSNPRICLLLLKMDFQPPCNLSLGEKITGLGVIFIL
jgi:hypothetical protein